MKKKIVNVVLADKYYRNPKKKNQKKPESSKLIKTSEDLF